MLTYNKSKETLDIVHLDCNSQYGWALSKAFLYGGFEYTEDISMFTCNYIKNSQKQWFWYKSSDFGYAFDYRLHTAITQRLIIFTWKK